VPVGVVLPDTTTLLVRQVEPEEAEQEVAQALAL